MTWNILISAPYMIPFMDRFRPILEARGASVLVADVEERLEEEDLLQLIEPIHGVICGDDRFTRKVMESAPNLKVISKWGTGIDSLDQVAAQEMGITICNTPGAFTDPVADSVMAYLLCFARRTPWQDRDLKSGTWYKMPGVSVREWKLGILGVGQIGQAVARRAAAFGMEILGVDPKYPDSEFIDSTGIKMVSLEEMLAGADVVSINCDLNPSSDGLMDAKSFAQMKSGAYLINTARGPVVQEEDLIAALESGHLAGAGLDVYAFEPLPESSPLRTMDQVLLVAHNANSSPACWEHVHQNSMNQMFAVLNKGM